MEVAAMSASKAPSVLEAEPLSDTELERIDAYWRAANYLSVGQIYLLDNPLLREPLRADHVKPRLLGHWGTTPGLNFIYAHANRAIVDHGLDAFFICGPGHGGPGVVANVYLEGTYSEIYPAISQDEPGLVRLVRQFSFPGGIDPARMHRAMAAAMDKAVRGIRAIQARARRKGAKAVRAPWPMIILRTPKGWTGPRTFEGKKVEGTFRAHQVPIADVHEHPE